MNLPLLAVAGLLVLFFAVTLPVFRERYGEKYEDERAFFRDQRPSAWTFVGDVSGSDDPAARERAPGHCPICGTENEPGYTFCRRCDSRLPAGDE